MGHFWLLHGSSMGPMAGLQREQGHVLPKADRFARERIFNCQDFELRFTKFLGAPYAFRGFARDILKTRCAYAQS